MFLFHILAIPKPIAMSENNEPETSYSKGEKFEKLFAEFMKSDLKWDKYIIRSQQKGKANSKGSQVDIIAEKKDDRGRVLHNMALAALLIFIGSFIVLLYFYYNNIIGSDDFISWTSGCIVIGVGSIAYSYLSSKFHKENAWVECKNRKTKTVYEDVVKSIAEYKDYKASGDKEYKYVYHYFVSANGFVENALKLAMDNNIICYEYKNEKFEKVTYWK